MKRTAKINWRRKEKEKPKLIPRIPQQGSRNRVIEPDTIYRRTRDKEILRRVYDYWKDRER